MIKNYLTVAFRNLFRSKVYSLINIFGLAIGMAAGFFIFQYVYFESSYDKFHTNADRLYRINMSYSGSFAHLGATAATHPAVAPAMKAEFPEVVDYVRLVPPNVFLKTAVVSYTDEDGQTKRFNESDFYFAENSFFNVFSFPLLVGDAATALQKPGSIVLTATMAKKYFGNADPVGKTIQINTEPLVVTAVCKDVPENSHIKFSMLIALDKNFEPGNWAWPEFYNYVLLTPGADVRKLEAQLPAFINRHMEAVMKEFDFRSYFHLQPLADIHLNDHYRMEPEPPGNKRTVYFLSVLGVFILIIAWINYINLTTAKSMERAREVGLRKVAGASRWQVARQFLLEAFIINSIALLVAILLVLACTPLFDSFIGKKISNTFVSSGIWHSWQFVLIFCAVFITGALQTGVYPAFILSAFKPALVLKGKFTRSNRGILLRKGLVAFQFALSILLIAGTMIVFRQLMYMRNQHLGYNKDQVLIVKAPAVFDSTFISKTYTFRNELLKNPAVLNMAPSSDIPGRRIFDRNSVRKAGEEKNLRFVPFLVEIDQHFLPTYQMQLACGSNLPERAAVDMFKTRKTKVLINEETVKKLGFASNEAALNKTIYITTWAGEIESEVTGVVKNYHQRSLKDGYDPIIYYLNGFGQWGYFSINMRTTHLSKNLADIEELYHKLFPGNAFERFFLNEFFNRQYKADEQLGNIIGLFTILAIFIACLGLTGLATYAIKLRTKEIGIRKVLGASAQGIVYLFYRDFIKLVCLAAVIAIPIVYYLASKWLENFAFHIQPGWLVFIAAPMLLLFVAFVTIGVQSVRAALDNPVNSLRND
ncbi:ABC transporter permease [Longitalea luteola]|uniref:ABC transporter permease n=1 Tax=Longitalea luteola TaxID=2812563 RepID=UPI001A96B063|nr:ABC transporter permease [Longitalea luteola]